MKSRVLFRIAAWIGIAVGLSVWVAPNFLNLLNETLNETFGNVFPAILFVALLLILCLIQRNGLFDLLESEGGLQTQKAMRLLGIGIIVALVLLIRPFAESSVYVSALAILLSFCASSLLVNPLTKRLMFSYGTLFGFGICVPVLITWALGGPLSHFSAFLSAKILSLSGIPVRWQGTQFVLISKTGEYLSAQVTPGCSSVISITTFLCLLVLMHFDLKKDISSTIKVAIVGIAILIVLNALRILILIWIGYSSGVTEFWTLHNWIGYTLFFGFYLTTIPIYARMNSHAHRGMVFLTRSKI